MVAWFIFNFRVLLALPDPSDPLGIREWMENLDLMDFLVMLEHLDQK